MSDEPRNTPVTFSREEIAEIRKMIEIWDKPPSCPRCEDELLVGEPGEQPVGQIYLICSACHRAAFISKERGQSSTD